MRGEEGRASSSGERCRGGLAFHPPQIEDSNDFPLDATLDDLRHILIPNEDEWSVEARHADDDFAWNSRVMGLSV